MAVLSLPLSFTNSFWSQDYRKGLEVLYKKLEQGTAEDSEIVAFIRARAQAEDDIGTALTNTAPTGHPGTGFSADDGATLLMAFRGLQAETTQQGGVHQAIARELQRLVADPFEEWAKGHHAKLRASRTTIIDGYVRTYEHAQADVIKLKNTYLSKVRKADEAEDDAKFAPNAEISDKYTTSPRLAPRDKPVRSATISERITQRLKEIQKKTSAPAAQDASGGEKTQLLFSDEKSDEGTPKPDKGKGKAVEDPSVGAISASPPPLSPPLPPPNLVIKTSSSPMPPEPLEPMLLAGLSLPPAAVSDLLTRAAAELKMRPVRFPILGEYHCFTGEEFVDWLNENVQGFGGSFDRAEDAARDLTERDGLLRRIGELGNFFEPADDAYYQFRPKAFELGKIHSTKQDTPLSPAKLTPVADNLIKRSNNFLNVVTKALNANANAEPPHVRARIEADTADREYRIAVRKLDRQRLGLEERIEDALKMLQRWETERLRNVKSVLLQFHGTLSNLPRALEGPLERSASHIAAYLPESDLSALIERYRTGPFRPQPQVYESIAHDESDVLFGIDLRKWSEGGWSTIHDETQKLKPLVPPVLTTLLDGLNRAYSQLQTDDEKRKVWIYEVPLPAVHHLRESLNAVPPEQPLPDDIVTKYDPPVVASAVKLWLLELDPPLALWEGWDDLRRLYPNVGSASKAEKEAASEQEHLDALKAALLRLPKIHLHVLDTVVLHLRTLIDNTTVEETDEVYITKLALSIGRTILRPRYETGVSVQDRHPPMFFIDLVKYYADVLPPTIAKKKADTERKVPLRKRTAPIDMRMSRSKLSVGTEARDWLVNQRAQGNIPPPVPPLPPVSQISSPAPVAAPVPVPVPAPAPAPAVPAQPSPPPPSSFKDIPSPPKTKSAPTPEPPQLAAPVPVPAASVAAPKVPARPSFKSPPPEEDDLPPRPTSFREPGMSPPPRPAFASPPPESEPEAPAPAPAPAAAAASVNVVPPTPHRRGSGSPRPIPVRATSPRMRSPPGSPSPLSGNRSPSPAVSPRDDLPLNSGRVSLSRNTSNDMRTRTPRGSRPPRVGGGGSVSSIVSNLNRNSLASDRGASPPPAALQPRARVRPQSGTIEDKRRSLTGLSPRTMDSDAEDSVVG
ncbi:hypothetical protein BC834DRAFT_857325 [Gloeopeniophorella convolvens]|nr:hypothetical protein BC834DRAFT_857325 [Gloeopeniophorella convolvens]